MLVYTSPLSIHNHYFKIYFDSETRFYYIDLHGYSQSITLIGVYVSLQSAQLQVSKLLKVL
jgi:hypothetical protein